MKKAILSFGLASLMALLSGCAAPSVSRAEVSETPASSGGSEENPMASSVSGSQGGEVASKTFTLNDVSFKMVRVGKGIFTMGSGNTGVAFSESPAHEVTLTRDYFIAETETTEALFNVVMGSGGGSPSMPKTSVTHAAAVDFAGRLTSLAREKGLIGADESFHLPSEAEWEFAAKGGGLSKGYRYSGGDSIDEVAVTRENSGSDSPLAVKTKKPNELGLYDMSGNAYEWVADYGGSYQSGAQTDPVNTTPSSTYVKRGGSNYHSFDSESYLFTTTGRYFYGSTDWTIGFRIALAKD